MGETAWVTRVGLVGRRLLTGGMLAVLAALVVPAAANAQVTAPDSAEIYEQFANTPPDRRGGAVGRNTLNDARRSFTLYEQRNDTAGQARALILIANEYDNGSGAAMDSLIAISGRAVVLLRRPHADSSTLAEAVGLFAYGLLNSAASIDSSAPHRAENLRLRQLYPAPKQQGRELWAHGHAFLTRSHDPAVVLKMPFISDSALRYLHAAIAPARAAADSATIAGSFGDIANVWLRQARLDSALHYRRRAFALSQFFSDERQMIADVRSIVGFFNAAPLQDRSRGLVRSVDSVMAWYRVLYRATQRFGPSAQFLSAVHLANAYKAVGVFDSSRVFMEEGMNLARKLSDQAVHSVSLELAKLYESAGFVDSAVAQSRYSETVSRTLTGPIARNLQMQARLALAESHVKRGDLDSAKIWYGSVVTSTHADLGLRFYNMYGLEGIAAVHQWRGESDSARLAYSRIQIGQEQLNLQDVFLRRRQRTAWLGEAAIFATLGLADSARIVTKRVLEVMTAFPKSQSSGDSIAPLTSLARIERYLGRPDSALALDQYVLRSAQERSILLTEIEARLSIGADYEALGALDSAGTHYRTAVSMTEKWQMRPLAVLSLGALASWYLSADTPDSALAVSRRAVARSTETASSWLLADARYRLGIIFGALGQSDSAAVNLESTLAQRGRPVGPSLVALGNLRLRMGQADTARALLHTALRSYRSSGARPAIAQTLTSLSRVEQQLGRPDSALAIASEALTLARATQDRLTQGRAFASLGRAQFTLGRTDSARAAYESALTVFRTTGFTRDTRETLAELAELFRLRRSPGDLERATTYFDSAATTFDNARRRTGDDELAVTFAEQQTDIYGGWARAWLGRRSDVGATRSTLAALGAVERGRGQALLQLLQRGSSAAPTVIGRAGTDLATEADSLLSGVRNTRSAALSYLQAGDTLFTWFVGPDGVVTLLPPQAITADEMARLITSARRSFAADDARSAELDPDAVPTAADSTTGKRDPADDLRRLAALLLPPDLAAKVPAGTPIIVVPHGAIASVPFAALDTRVAGGATPRTPAGGRRPSTPVPSDTTPTTLGARYPLRFAPSFAALRATERSARILTARVSAPSATPARTWTATRAAGAAPVPAIASSPRRTRIVDRTLLAQSLVVGNPTMPFVYSGRSSTRSQLRSLPGAEAESRSIARQLGARVLTGSAATETSVRRRMRGAPIIHFATHGLGYGTAAQARRSYVAFAPDSAQDGLLTLGELMDDRTLTLRAELVVLSACQTGLGNLRQAEGTIGLQRAFLAKGARSVLVSLWNVDDAATRLLMEHFYRAWLNPVRPRSKAVALQLAQAAVRNTPGFAHPRYWAAFQLVGAE